MSATVRTGNSGPYGRPVAGLIEPGPVEPRQLPIRLAHTTKCWSVSNALPGPIMPSHQPRPPRGWMPRSSAPMPSTALGASDCSAQPAAWASPLSAWQTRMTLSRAGVRLPYVSYARRNSVRLRPESSGSGSVKSTNWVPTTPTEPGWPTTTWRGATRPCMAGYLPHRAGEAAVDGQHAARDVVTGAAAQEHRRARQVIWLTPAASGCAPEHILRQACDGQTGGVGQLGLDPAGQDREIGRASCRERV